jgi:glycosyltransferase involved in cell wall biosynthesis
MISYDAALVQVSVAIIVPCFNEARLVGRTLRRIPSWVDLIVVVDDASSDATVRAILSVADERIVLLRHEVNRGVGAAIATGYGKAIERKSDVMVVMAGDDQMDPADLTRLIAPIIDGTADYVKGNRFVHAQASRMPWFRRVGSALLSWITRLASGLQVDDTQCGYTALSGAAARQLPLGQLWPRFGYPNDLLMLLAALGLTVHEVPVRPVYGDEKSGLRAWHVLQIMAVIYRRWRQTRAAQLSGSSISPEYVLPELRVP